MANPNPEPIANAIGDYRRYGLGGVFAWQVTASFRPIANLMWLVEHLTKDGRIKIPEGA